MKKVWIVISIVVVALMALGVGVVFAQDELPPVMPYGHGGMGGGRGIMHDFMEQALAAELKITEDQVEKQLASGVSMYQVALDNGIAEADIAAFLTKVHTAAFDKAVADGVVTQEQADAMLQRMATNSLNGNCPMGGNRPQDGTGMRRGPGMMGGFGGQRQNVAP